MGDLTMTQEDYDLFLRAKKARASRQKASKESIEKQLAGMSIESRSNEMKRRRLLGISRKRGL